MTGKLVNLLKNGHIVIPQVLLSCYKNFKITDKELIVLIYLIGNQEFDPAKIATNLDITSAEVLTVISSLSKKDILELKQVKIDNAIEEVLSLEQLYNKLALSLMEEKTQTKEINLFDKFEKEFGRTLSPIEYEIIGAWTDQFNEEIILLALKEAVYNGVSNLRYIDKILYEWKKKGIKNAEDVKIKRKKKETKKEVFDYDWLSE